MSPCHAGRRFKRRPRRRRRSAAAAVPAGCWAVPAVGRHAGRPGFLRSVIDRTGDTGPRPSGACPPSVPLGAADGHTHQRTTGAAPSPGHAAATLQRSYQLTRARAGRPHGGPASPPPPPLLPLCCIPNPTSASSSVRQRNLNRGRSSHQTASSDFEMASGLGRRWSCFASDKWTSE